MWINESLALGWKRLWRDDTGYWFFAPIERLDGGDPVIAWLLANEIQRDHDGIKPLYMYRDRGAFPYTNGEERDVAWEQLEASAVPFLMRIML